jgi:hypothetical protein
MTLTLPDFIARWQGVTLTEKSAAQQHFIDLCDLLGHPRPAEADPQGTSFTLEKGVSKIGGGQGFADVWKRGYFAWEYKGKHKNLDAAIELTAQELEILGRTATLDWQSVEPAIFGTLFERSLDPSKRAQLGAHYTSREDILLIVEPVLMQPLRRRWEEVQQQAREIIAKRDTTPDRAARTRYQRELEEKLRGFAEEIARIRVLDAYGWPHELSDEEILERLLALNLRRAGAQGGSPPPAAVTEDGEGAE